MVTVTRNAKAPAEGESPSAQVIADAKKEIEVTDALGRQILVRKLTPLERLRFLRLVGDETKLYIAHSSIAASCAGINGDREGLPTSIAQIEAMTQRLGEEGFEAVLKAFQEAGWTDDGASVRDAAKN